MSGKAIKTFEDFKCWQACKELRLFVVREIVPFLPNDEKYRLADQFLRASRSTTANIADGYWRFHYLDNAKFCTNSRGSCWEVLDHLITANDEGMVSLDVLEKCRELVNTAVKLINGYMNYLKKGGKAPYVQEEPAEYATFDCGYQDNIYSITNNI